MNLDNETSNYLESIKTYRMEYYCKNKEKINTSSKEYYNSNKDKCLERMKNYRELNKDELNEKKNTRLTCECGSSYTLSNKSKHLQSKKHNKLLTTTSSL